MAKKRTTKKRDSLHVLIVEARFYDNISDELLRGATRVLDNAGARYDFEIVSNESARGLMDLAVNERLPIGNGILTVDNEAQALARARPEEGDKGGDAARAALTMVALKHTLAWR
jgi:6,7-dimethyl-8-ribityllumazine synthase